MKLNQINVEIFKSKGKITVVSDNYGEKGNVQNSKTFDTPEESMDYVSSILKQDLNELKNC